MYWPQSTWVELNELCIRLKVRLEFDEHSNLYGIVLPASDDDVIQFRLTNPQQLYTAVKKMEVDKDLQHFESLQRQGRLQREALPFTDMSCSVCHLTNSSLTDHLTRFIAKGRLQLLETSAVNRTYYPHEYTGACPLCAFQHDTNSHALNCCRRLRGLYVESHVRCAGG
eukprot:TRINITY_DN35831_c0_g2_i12.p3 TRINITY_DN35831_c0_g2~~TRINITY_DN35831_c0_g2_i12.p3  ORF type:complete len:169 (-),score=34.12 TRINITY_DN35831_c0_g2_i12:71-577(-)